MGNWKWEWGCRNLRSSNLLFQQFSALAVGSSKSFITPRASPGFPLAADGGAICPSPLAPAFLHSHTHLSYYLWVYYFSATLLFNHPLWSTRDPISFSRRRRAKSFGWRLKLSFIASAAIFHNFINNIFSTFRRLLVPRLPPMRLWPCYLFSGFVWILSERVS